MRVCGCVDGYDGISGYAVGISRRVRGNMRTLKLVTQFPGLNPRKAPFVLVPYSTKVHIGGGSGYREGSEVT